MYLKSKTAYSLVAWPPSTYARECVLWNQNYSLWYASLKPCTLSVISEFPGKLGRLVYQFP